MYFLLSLFISFLSLVFLQQFLLLLACADSVLCHKAASSHLWWRFADLCFSSCSVPKWVTHNCSSLGCPCPRCPCACSRVSLCLPASLWPGVLAQLCSTNTTITCGQTSLGWQGSQTVWHSCSPGQTAGLCLLCLRLPLYTAWEKILTLMVFVWMKTLCFKVLIPLGTQALASWMPPIMFWCPSLHFPITGLKWFCSLVDDATWVAWRWFPPRPWRVQDQLIVSVSTCQKSIYEQPSVSQKARQCQLLPQGLVSSRVLIQSDVFLISQTEISVTNQCFLTPVLASTIVSVRTKIQGGPRSFPVFYSFSIYFEETFERGSLRHVF